MAIRQHSKLNLLSSGCVSLDRMLQGGLKPKQLALIYGEAATGKTTLALQYTINCARKGYVIIYIDTDGTFPSKRFKQMASDYENIAPQIGILTPKDFFQQTILFENLDAYITDKTGLIVVDTINSLYRLEVNHSQRFTYKEFNRNLAYLASVSKKYALPILLTSQVHAQIQKPSQTEKIEPVATRTLNFWASTIMKLQSHHKPNVKTAFLERQGGKNYSNIYCLIRFTNRGIL